MHLPQRLVLPYYDIQQIANYKMATAYLKQPYDIIPLNNKGYDMTENWKQCKGFEGYYEVSDLGRVRTVARESVKSNGRKCIVKEKVLSQANVRGYKKVTLKCDGVRKDMRVHRLIAMAFLDGEKEMVNHIDGDKTNNTLSNLEWATRSENELHAYSTELKKSTELHKSRTSEANKARRTLSDDTIRYIRSSELSQYKLADELGISRASVGLIKQRKRYADVA